MTVSQPLTDEELDLVRTAAFGAIFLVSNADPGLFSMLKESFAASDAIAAAQGMIKVALTEGGPPTLPAGTPADVELVVLAALRRSVEILGAKAPAELHNFRTVVVSAIEEVARASAGISEVEAAMMDKVRNALGVPA
jgi:hypothetical protein